MTKVSNAGVMVVALTADKVAEGASPQAAFAQATQAVAATPNGNGYSAKELSQDAWARAQLQPLLEPNWRTSKASIQLEAKQLLESSAAYFGVTPDALKQDFAEVLRRSFYWSSQETGERGAIAKGELSLEDKTVLLQRLLQKDQDSAVTSRFLEEAYNAPHTKAGISELSRTFQGLEPGQKADVILKLYAQREQGKQTDPLLAQLAGDASAGAPALIAGLRDSGFAMQRFMAILGRYAEANPREDGPKALIEALAPRLRGPEAADFPSVQSSVAADPRLSDAALAWS